MRNSRFHRRTSKAGRVTWWYIVTLPVVILAIILGSVLFFTRMPRRYTVAVAASPVQVWSWDLQDRSAIIMRISEDTVVEGAYGYGKYSLKALWRLGVIDHAGGSVFAQSISGALGIPVDGYIGSRSQDGLIGDGETPVSPKSVFSWRFLHRFVTGGWRTDIRNTQAIVLARHISGMKTDEIETIDFAKRQLMYDEEMPDGTKQSTLDTERVDAILKSKFENPQIRKEALSVSLLNGTSVPALAGRAARLLGSMGVLVISVDNAPAKTDHCEILGNKTALDSETAVVISNVLVCTMRRTEEKNAADLRITIGSEFATRFIAKSEKTR